MTDEEWNGIAGVMAFHLQDTHGYPQEEFKKWLFDKDGTFRLLKLVGVILKHSDFRKKYLNRDWSLKK